MNNLTPKERRRLRESVAGNDPMVLAQAEAAFADELAKIERRR